MTDLDLQELRRLTFLAGLVLGAAIALAALHHLVHHH